MKRAIWPIIATAAVFALGVVTTLALQDHAEQRAIIKAQATTSAATSITLFLVVTLLVIGALAAAVVAASYYLRRWQENEKMRKAAQQAQIYAMLQGAQLPAPRRPAMPHQAVGGGNTYVFPQGQQPTLPPSNWEVYNE